jgi:hypothetical protein
MNRAAVFFAVAWAMLSSLAPWTDSQWFSTEAGSKRKKKCLNCPTKHDHHNDFCSADCCKEYRASKRITQ